MNSLIYKGEIMLQTGIKGIKEITVTQDKTAKAMGSGTLDVSQRRP